MLDKAPIIWRAFKQKSICLSTMESEFVALTEATKDLWFSPNVTIINVITKCYNKHIFTVPQTKPTLLVDNMAAIDFIKFPIKNYRTKHIDVKLFFVRDLLNQEIFLVKHIISKSNFSDVFTKPLTKADLRRFIGAIFNFKS